MKPLERCRRCKAEIPAPDIALGDRQGGPMMVARPGFLQKNFALCAECAAPIFDAIEGLGEIFYNGGTVREMVGKFSSFHRYDLPQTDAPKTAKPKAARRPKKLGPDFSSQP